MSITLEQVKKSEEITSYIRKADESLSALGFTEHSFAHVGLVSAQASAILKTLGYDDRTCELAAIAGWLHDIGNVVNRIDHAQSGAVMAFRILDKMGASPEETATIITAIGNHDEKTAFPVNPVAAALILADKMDVRANRVREKARAAFDIHDRVNYSVKKHEVTLTEKEICLTLAIDCAAARQRSWACISRSSSTASAWHKKFFRLREPFPGAVRLKKWRRLRPNIQTGRIKHHGNSGKAAQWDRPAAEMAAARACDFC